MNKLHVCMISAGLLLVSGCAADSSKSYARTEGCAADSAPVMRESARPVYARGDAAPRAVGKQNFQVPAGHHMTFTARLGLNVGNVRTAVDQSRRLAMKFGGYVKRMDNNSTVLAIPVKKADAALTELSKLGVLNSLTITGDDVTQQVTDLKIRLENLEKSRKRLLALLEKAGKVDEMVKVETAIARVTTELERLQAQQNNLNLRIAYVTMYVNFKAAVTHRVIQPTSPVAWVNSLGSNLLAFNRQITNNGDSLIIDLKLPAGFVKNGSTGAVSGNHCIIELAAYDNAVTATHWYGNDYAGIGFYVPMIRKALEERFKTKVTLTRCKIDGYDAAVYTVKPVIGGISYTLRIAVAVVKSHVKVITVRARTADFDKALPEAAWKKLIGSVDF